MKTIWKTLALAGVLACTTNAGFAQSSSTDKGCDAHGKITVLTKTTITVDDQLFKVGDSTRVLKNGHEAALKDLKVGDFVCVDTRGNDDMEGQIVAVKVLNSSEAKHYREKETITHEHERVKESESETQE